MAPVGRRAVTGLVVATGLFWAATAPALAAPSAVPATMSVLGVTVPRHDPLLAMSASLVLTGAGQAYNDEWLKGGLMLAGDGLYLAGYLADFFTGQTVFRWAGLGLL